MRPHLIAIALLGSSLLTPAVAEPRARASRRAALQRTAPPTAITHPVHVTPKTPPARRMATAMFRPTAQRKAELDKLTEGAGATFGTPKFKKLIGLFGAPRATINGSDPSTKEGQLGVVPGSKTFVKGVNYKDVNQGHLGDCYFVAALDAVAYTHPKLIEENLKENTDGSLSLRMYHQTAKGYEADTVNMSKAIPLVNGRPTFARGADPTQLWPAYFQKAYVIQNATNGGKANSYPAIQGGFPGDAFSMLTGKPSQRYSVTPSLGEQLFTVMQRAHAGKNPVAAWTPDNLPEGGLVHGDHTYTVLGVTERGGQKFVQLRNPWGYSPGNDGIFELDLPTFAKTFVGLDVGG